MSNMSERDRKALTWGGLGVATIIVFNYVLSPVWQRWSEASDRLASREAFIASFRERVDTRDSLRTRRDVLALRLGSLRVLHVKEEKSPEQSDKGDKPYSEKDEQKKADKDAASTDAKNVAEATPVPAPENGKDSDKPKPDHADVTNPSEDTDSQAERPPVKAETSDDTSAIPVAKNEPMAADAPAKSDDAGAAGVHAQDEGSGGGEKEKQGEEPVSKGKEAGSNGDTTNDAASKKEEKDAKPSRVAVPVIEASSLATYVEKTAKAAQIKLKRITPKKNSSGKKRTKYFEPVTLQVNFECQVTNLVQLLHDLEKGELFVRVDKVEITRDVAQGDKLNASLDISSYELKKELS